MDGVPLTVNGVELRGHREVCRVKG